MVVLASERSTTAVSASTTSGSATWRAAARAWVREPTLSAPVSPAATASPHTTTMVVSSQAGVVPTRAGDLHAGRGPTEALSSVAVIRPPLVANSSRTLPGRTRQPTFRHLAAPRLPSSVRLVGHWSSDGRVARTGGHRHGCHERPGPGPAPLRSPRCGRPPGRPTTWHVARGTSHVATGVPGRRAAGRHRATRAPQLGPTFGPTFPELSSQAPRRGANRARSGR